MTRKSPPQQPCRRCEEPFTNAAGSPANTLCRRCYFEAHRDYDFALAEQAFEHGYRLGLQRARQHDEDDLEAVLGGLPLLDLVTLCHPDRHPPERFELANRITSWLNGLRDTAAPA